MINLSSFEKTISYFTGCTGLGEWASPLLQTLSCNQRVTIGAIKGLAVSVGALALLILGAKVLAPKLPETQNLVALLSPSALYDLGKSYFTYKRPTHIHKQQNLENMNGMKKNLGKAIENHSQDQDKECYMTLEQASRNNPSPNPLILNAEVTSAIGLGPPKNQDAHLRCQFNVNLSDPHHALYGVFDGHGSGGEVAAALIARTFEVEFQKCLIKNGQDILRTFEEVINIAHQGVKNLSSTVSIGGSTAVVCYWNPKTKQLYTATLGDSEANIYRKIDGVFKSLPLSPLRDWETDEKKVENQLNKNYFIHKDASKGTRLHNNSGSNTNVSRSIGDLGFPMVSQKPKVTITTLCPEDILVLCSDGLKNSLKEQEIIDLIAKNEQNSSKEIANVLVQESLEKQKTTKKDNVTAMVVKVTEKNSVPKR